MTRPVFACIAGLAMGCGVEAGALDAGAEPVLDAGGESALDAGSPSDAGEIVAPERAWEDEIVYLVMPDRFVNGDPANDALGVRGCDADDPRVGFHGGDLAGIEASVEYLRELGATTLWSTPLARQALGPGTTCPYHGYWIDYDAPDDDGAIDDGRIEPRLGDARSLDSMIAALHRAGVRVVLDAVANHAGDRARIVAARPEFFADPATCADDGRPLEDCPFRPGSPDFRLARPDVAQLVVEAQLGWLARHAFDGVRVDAARHLPAPFVADSLVPALRAARPEGWSIRCADDVGSGA